MPTRIQNKLNALKPKNSSYEEKYKDGLFVQVRPTGSKSWIFRYSRPSDNKQIRMVLGKYEDHTFDEIEDIHLSYRRLVRDGMDPQRIRAAEVIGNKQALTCDALFEAWIDQSRLSKEVNEKWVKRHEDRWRLHLKKPLKPVLARDVTRSHLAAALDSMTRKGIKEETRKALTTLNLMFDYGVARYLVESNPARLLKPKDFGATASRPRIRWLGLEDLRKLWVSIDMASEEKDEIPPTPALSLIVNVILKMLIITGCRRGEVVGMEWKEIDFKTGAWTIPWHKVKNKQAHTVYLPKIALELIDTVKPITGRSRYVFESIKVSGQSTSPDSITMALRRLQVCEEGHPLANVAYFTVHDLRRSAATAWAEHLKISPHIIERMLNHQPLNKLVATYQRALYVEEQKQAWKAWGDMVEAVIANDQGNVVPFRGDANKAQHVAGNI